MATKKEHLAQEIAKAVGDPDGKIILADIGNCRDAGERAIGGNTEPGWSGNFAEGA